MVHEKIHAFLDMRTVTEVVSFAFLLPSRFPKQESDTSLQLSLLAFSGLSQVPVFWVFQLQRTHFQTLWSYPLEIPLTRQWCKVSLPYPSAKIRIGTQHSKSFIQRHLFINLLIKSFLFSQNLHS